MDKWITHVNGGWSQSATVKSRIDINRIAEKMDYKPLYFFPMLFEWEDYGPLHSRIDGITAGVNPDDLIIFQYPSMLGYKFDWEFVHGLKARGAKIAIFIQDAVLLREGGGTFGSNFDEIAFYNMSDLVIAHSPRMEAWLKEHGVTTPIINRLLHDFLIKDHDAELTENLEKKLVFAGSLYKSPFMSEWNYQTELLAYGLKPDDMVLSEKVTYGGSFPNDELIRQIPKDRFGLFWDNMEGPVGEYTKYNAAHKVSLYLALGMPVIVWDQSAAAEVINKYHLGYALSSLDEIDALMARLGDEELKSLKENVNHFSAIMRDGNYTRNALIDTEKHIFLNL